MSRARLLIAAATAPMLLLATPASAKPPHARHSARDAQTARMPLIAPPFHLTREESARVAAGAHPIAPPEDVPQTMLGSWPVVGDVNFGVGLFSVVGATEKERMRRRDDPMRDLKPANTRVAAVGLNLSF